MRIVEIALGAATTLVSGAAFAQGTCTTPKTTCVADGGYYAPADDVARVTSVSDPVLRELKACLDAAGGKHITPAMTMRWSSEGKPVAVKIEAPGYDTLPCVAKAAGKLSTLQNPHETAMRCELGCNKPPAAAPPPPAAAPIVVQPPPAPAPAPGTANAITEPPKPAPKLEREWYGWQTLIADGAAVSIYFGGVLADASGLRTAGFLAYLFAAPIVHFTHANIGKGFGSFGMRIGLLLGGAGIGALTGVIVGSPSPTRGSGQASDFPDVNPVLAGAILGTAAGVAGAIAIDAFSLAYEKVTAKPAPTAIRATPNGFLLQF
jgi:hypothetical protein